MTQPRLSVNWPSMPPGAALVAVAGALIIAASMGLRQTFGLFVTPLSVFHGFPVTVIAFAIALHNLVWGISQPFVGATADRYGATPVVAVGAVMFASGLALTASATTVLPLILGLGILVGLGISCTGFGVVLPSIGRTVTPERRSMILGLVTAGGSVGQVLLVPLAQWVSLHRDMVTALWVLAVVALAAAPLGVMLDRRRATIHTLPDAHHASAAATLRMALAQAYDHRGYRLLTVGFFACGFHLAFIATHLPGYLSLCRLPEGTGATALALIGLFNMLGTWGCGWLGGRFRQHYVLGWVYLVRAVAVAIFAAAPKSAASVEIFAAVAGLTWLGTVPLTSGLVAKLFGTRHLGTLFGICFLSHQLGSFLGAWSGGWVVTVTGSFTVLWVLLAIAGLVAAWLHFLIDDAPIVTGGAAAAASS